MTLLVHIQELFDVEVGVFLSCGEALMSEEFLNETEIRPPGEKMGGEGVSKGVGADFPP